MAEAARSEELRAAFKKHHGETEQHIGRLEQVFAIIEKKPQGKTRAAIVDITDEGAEIMREYKGSIALDAGLLAAAQAVEHYEISRYGTLRTWAELGGRRSICILPSPNSAGASSSKGDCLRTRSVKYNFAYPDPGPGAGTGRYAVFVGRLSAEKGVETLLEAWRHLGGSVPLKLVGDGPMAATVREAAAKDAAIRWLGNMPLDAIYGVLGAAKLLVLPSQCYETFARIAIEAFAKGTPVIGSRLGAMVEIVDEDAIDLAEKVRRVLADPLELARMRQAARQKFDRYFTADVNHKSLMAIYERVFGDRPGPELRS